MASLLETLAEQEGEKVGRVRQYVREALGVTDPALETEVSKGIAASFLFCQSIKVTGVEELGTPNLN